jgi:hypothetical protein
MGKGEFRVYKDRLYPAGEDCSNGFGEKKESEKDPENY